VEDLRRGWDAHVEFGLAQPAFYALMYGAGRSAGAASEEAHRILLLMTEAVARAGRLRVPVHTAAGMIRAACMGVTLDLISGAGDATDLSARTREAVLAAVTTDEAEDRPSSVSAMAIALASAIEGEAPHTLTTAETTMLREWLARIAVE
jgi:hypothetical protein